MAKELNNKKIGMIIAFRDFRDEECFIPKSVFLNEGFEVKIVSSQKGEAVGSYGGVMPVDLSLNELKINDFSAIVFVGGAGASQYFEDKQCHQITKDAASQNKILGAICIAPVILAQSGVLKSKKATVWSSPTDKTTVKMLEQGGAEYIAKPIVRDGNIITANGSQTSRQFAEIIIRVLRG